MIVMILWQNHSVYVVIYAEQNVIVWSVHDEVLSSQGDVCVYVANGVTCKVRADK